MVWKLVPASIIRQLFSAIDDWHVSTNYTYLQAVYLDSFGVQDPLGSGQVISVNSGDRIPGIPENLIKMAVGVDLWQKLSLGINGLYSGGQVFRGDEANIGKLVAGYWLFNATAEYKFNKHFSVFGKLDNVFNNNYSSFGVYGNAAEVLGSNFD